ncbi:MAG: hypothetical protein DK306_000539 [Chloroflexi bacterium]|nr:MAG: hypothetical protein DK306_000539 [Chloroflexota bacterium]
MDSFPDTAWDPSRPDIERLLRESLVTDSGVIPSASNYVFLLALAPNQESPSDAAPAGEPPPQEPPIGPGYAVYKPARGESPLWDFPPDIYRREVASYLVSEALGWGLVPPTVLREDGLPHGPGSMQAFIPTDHTCTFFDLRDTNAGVMRRMATFDWLTNNADRKGGHVLQGADGRIWGIDNALSFHVEEKLRTVIWDYAGEPVPAPLLTDLEAFLTTLTPDSALWASLMDHLQADECAELRQRAQQILESPTFPQPPESRRPYPWPLI